MAVSRVISEMRYWSKTSIFHTLSV